MTRNRLLLILLLLTYWAISLVNLAAVPELQQDEPWQASTGWKIAQEGIFGSDMFAGYHGMERHYYGYMPIHPLLLSLFYRAGGLGLFQSRLETVTLGLLTLALTYHLGRRLFDRRVALLAVAFLLLVRHTNLLPHHLSGILFLDIARIARYDMAVPVFGLLALAVYARGVSGSRFQVSGSGFQVSGSRFQVSGSGLQVSGSGLQIPDDDPPPHTPHSTPQTPFPTSHLVTLSPSHLVIPGSLAALATLSHVYGLFWLVSLGLLVVWQGVMSPQKPGFYEKPGFSILRNLFYLGLGFAGPMLLYAAYVLPGWADWQAQTQGYTPRFELFNLRWYAANLVGELNRYHPGLESWFRPGLLATILIFPASLVALTKRAWRGDAAAQIIIIPAIVFPVLFALLIYLKLNNYLVTILPLWSLAAAWGVMRLVTSHQLPVISKGDHTGYGSLITGHRSLLTGYWSLITGHWSLLTAHRSLLTTHFILLLGLLVAAEGVGRITALHRTAASTTPYAEFAAALHAPIPPDSRILGLHNYWLGFEDTTYLSWVVPLTLAGATYEPFVQSISTSLTQFQPDFILIDRHMRDYFDVATEADPRPAAIQQWLRSNGYTIRHTVQDPTYGLIEIYAPDS